MKDSGAIWLGKEEQDEFSEWIEVVAVITANGLTAPIIQWTLGNSGMNLGNLMSYCAFPYTITSTNLQGVIIDQFGFGSGDN